jgi:purine-cytosine permease-like protein
VSFATKLVAFALFTVAYWFVILVAAGMFAYALVCHYPDVPGCETDLTLVWAILIAAVGIYAWAIYGFRRWTKEDRGGYR